MYDTPETVLKHHGVKGMKWGVRKTRHKSSENDQHTTARALAKRVSKLDSYTLYYKGMEKAAPYLERFLKKKPQAQEPIESSESNRLANAGRLIVTQLPGGFLRIPGFLPTNQE